MRFLTRDAFAGRWLNADGLQAVAVLWMELYEHTLRTGARRKPGFCLVEAELWGFPRVHAEWYRQGIEQRAREWGLYDVRVELKDADTLRVTGPEAATPPISSLARWFHLCLSQELQGLWCELRISARDRPGSSAKETGYGGSLAVSGMLQGGGFQLLALWPSPHNRATDAVYVWVRWEHEKAFLALLDGAPGPTGPRRLPAWVAPLFGEAGSSRLGDLTLAFLGPNERSVRAFLGRIALSAAGAGVTGYLLFITSQRGFRFGSLLFLGAFLLSLAGLGFTVWSKWRVITGYHQGMKRSFQKLYTQSIRFPEVDLQALQVSADPSLRKFSADLEALACRHHLDVTIEPPLSGRFYNRIYLLPDGQSFLCLALMRATQSLEVFPGKPSFLVTTYLSDGTRVVSSNYRGGYRKPLPMALVGRSFPDAEHPEALIKCHQALVERLCRDGRTPAPLDPALIVDRMIEEHEATRPLMEQVGYYTWEDAFRESFDLPRPEYRE